MKRGPMIMILFFLLIVVLIDIYAFKGVRNLTLELPFFSKRLLHTLFWAIPLLIFIGVLVVLFNANKFPDQKAFNLVYYVMGFFVLFYVPKLLFITFHFADDLVSILGRITSAIFGDSSSVVEFTTRIRNSIIITQIGIVVAIIPFLSIFYGITHGKFNYRVNEIDIVSDRLPDAFDGYKLVQISDMHSGSFIGHEKQLQKAVQLINKQNPDLILFTGDIVNNTANELDGLVPVLKDLKAKYGKYAILGNHDYGEYARWDSEEEQIANMEKLKRHHIDIGFDLLLNASVDIKKDSSAISLIGVENWGNPPFPQYGDLKKAMENVNGSPFKILLSHDPSHWDAEVKGKTDIDLTLSGHTHGMQFGINIPGLRWSPVKWKYPRWRGLYVEGDQSLYVNIGIGFIAFPGRVGAPPEITVFTLKTIK